MNFDATNMDAEFVQCLVCEKEITGGKWAARIRHGNRMVALCCPLCLETFETNSDLYVRRLETVELLQATAGPFADATPRLPPIAQTPTYS
jgi:hypothetical protein